MKNPKIIIKESGVAIFDCPEEPDFNNPIYQKFEGLGVQGKDYQKFEIDRLIYLQALSTAKKEENLVYFKDQEFVIKQFFPGCPEGAYRSYLIDHDGFEFDLPSGYRVDFKEACGHDSCVDDGRCDHCQSPVKVALLIPLDQPSDRVEKERRRVPK